MAELFGGGVSADWYPAGFLLRAALRDGTSVCVRAIRPDDKERLRIAFERLSTRSVYQRFFHPITELTPSELRHLTELDFRDHVGLVLTIEEETGERLIAVARFVRIAPGADRAEVGFAVADEYQNRGAATLLLHQLIALARGRGVREFVAQVLEDNLEMLAVFQNSKLPLRQRLERGIRHVVLSLDAGT
jgi:RimJ/RimL family protein N-acetyltransferase